MNVGAMKNMYTATRIPARTASTPAVIPLILRNLPCIEFDGTGQTTGNGVAFAGAITDVQVVDNWFHNLGGSGIAFGGAVNNNQGIQGNLFQALGADAIVSPTTAVNAEYNSWDAYGGASLANVDSDPWTHVDLYVQIGRASCRERV